jgi:hypothetical protein
MTNGSSCWFSGIVLAAGKTLTDVKNMAAALKEKGSKLVHFGNRFTCRNPTGKFREGAWTKLRLCGSASSVFHVAPILQRKNLPVWLRVSKRFFALAGNNRLYCVHEKEKINIRAGKE